MSRIWRDRAMVLTLALAIDLLFGEPSGRLHPVNWAGGMITRLEKKAPAHDDEAQFWYGAASLFGLAIAVTGTALGTERLTSRLPCPARWLTQAVMLKPSFALRMFLRSAESVQAALLSGNLPPAREALRSLVSRETLALSESEVAAAAIESLAENTTDSIVGPWLGFVLCGLPGAWCFRAVNTLDSRWGYRGAYQWLGRAAATVDDCVAFVPARLSAILLIAGMPAGGANALAAATVALRDQSRTPSPNGGWTMSAMAGGLGLRLGKPGAYVLNPSGSAAAAADIGRARRIVACAAAIGWLITALPAGISIRRRCRRSHPSDQ